jgi:hypothetical protein
MEREARQLLMAVTRIKTAISASGNRAGLANCVMDSRNWTLSVAMSHCYVECMLGANSSYALPMVFRFLFENAVDAGVGDGSKDLTQGLPDPHKDPRWLAAHGG